MQKVDLKYRAIKIVNSAISFTNVIPFSNTTCDELYEKIHNYGNVRPGLINNTYAIRQYLSTIVNTTYIDLQTSVKTPAADIIVVNNNSRYDLNSDLSKMTDVKVNDDIVFKSKSKTILYIDNDLKVNIITLDDLKKLVGEV